MSTPADGSATKGGRNLRKRDTAACPLCFNTFYTGELEAHVSACLYFLEEASDRKKHKKARTTPPKIKSFSTDTSPIKQEQGRLSTPNPKSNISSNTTANTNHVASNNDAQTASPSADAEAQAAQLSADWDIEEAPIFRPTTEEFQHPLKYIASIRPQAEKYGICRIIPPYPCETWNKNIDPESFIFKTKVQNIHQLKTRWQGPNEVFVSGLCAFLDKRGTPLRSVPKVDGRDLDLFKLFVSVVKSGGMQEVNRRNSWKDVANELRISESGAKSNVLRQHYYKILYPYELYRKNKRQRQMERYDLDLTTVAIAVAADVQAECVQPTMKTQFASPIEESEDNEFGFYDGKYFILQKFEKMAHAFQRKWFPDVKKPDHKAVEREFWRIVDTADENVQVHYGSDLDVAKHSSGFPRDPPPPSSAITPALSHWNLNHLPRMEGSVLRHITGQISGVTDPMIYCGMLFSSFCWHTEDNYLYSINYLHKGACKTWYGVPASAAEHFESVMKEAVPELFMKHPDLLHLLITMISPAVLLKNKVPVVRTVQEPGQYVITFPQAYHAGFSHGFTCAEAVNFAPADWLPYGASSVETYRELQRGGVFSHEQLLCSIAQKDPSPETAYYLYTELKKVREREQKLRDSLRLAGLTMQMTGNTSSVLEGEPNQCKICRYDCYLSSVGCACSPQHVTCLHHAEQLCRCEMRKKVIQVRVPMNILDDVIAIVDRKKSNKLTQIAQIPIQRNNNHSGNNSSNNNNSNLNISSGGLNSSNGSIVSSLNNVHINNNNAGVTNKENSVHLSNKARSPTTGGGGGAKTNEVIVIDLSDDDTPPTPSTATTTTTTPRAATTMTSSPSPSPRTASPSIPKDSVPASSARAATNVVRENFLFASPERLYGLHVPPAPSITATPVNYTPSSLSKIALPPQMYPPFRR